MIRCRRTLAWLLVLGCSTARQALADQALPAWDSGKVLGFADSLLAEGESFRAITEYMRAIYILPGGQSTPRARAVVGIGAAYFRGNDFIRASDWLTRQMNEYRNGEFWADGQKLLYRSLIRTGDLHAVRALAEDLASPESDFYSGVALAYGRNWLGAKRKFESLEPNHPYHEAARINMGVLSEAASDSYKSPRFAGALAVVPGLGYLYADHPQSALTAVFMNSLLMFGSFQAFRAKQYALGGVVSFLSLTWYAGNIYGSVQAARRFNDRQAERYLLRLQE